LNKPERLIPSGNQWRSPGGFISADGKQDFLEWLATYLAKAPTTAALVSAKRSLASFVEPTLAIPEVEVIPASPASPTAAQ